MKLYLDRIEGECLVFLLNHKTFCIPKEVLPDACEGEIYEITKCDKNINNCEKLVNKLFD